MSRLSLPLTGQEEPEIPLYQGTSEDLERDIWTVSRRRLAEQIAPISWPSKMDCPSWGLPVEHCKTGTRLAQKKGTTCADCYAAKGTFRFETTRARLQLAYRGVFHPLWVPALVQQIRWYADERFRFFHSGDLQSITHLRNIIRVCLETPDILHWLPTREKEFALACKGEVPPNLIIRASATRIDGPPPKWWLTTSTVVTVATAETCPSSVEGGSCADHGCNRCWDRQEKNIPYLRH